ncbi:CLUMA_CG010404, isoform A [Clunio marinus]|uniref:CLUMA_CG010404, isoform A n=1 Tax=Clunio marinus TaxID=568069 RepID=A0A1J1IBN2_9DIPT|nr:CLUMA_CG010404, isoform A [Clunio marinus]
MSITLHDVTKSQMNLYALKANESFLERIFTQLPNAHVASSSKNIFESFLPKRDSKLMAINECKSESDLMTNDFILGLFFASEIR